MKCISDHCSSSQIYKISGRDLKMNVNAASSALKCRTEVQSATVIPVNILSSFSSDSNAIKG